MIASSCKPNRCYYPRVQINSNDTRADLFLLYPHHSTFVSGFYRTFTITNFHTAGITSPKTPVTSHPFSSIGQSSLHSFARRLCLVYGKGE